MMAIIIMNKQLVKNVKKVLFWISLMRNTNQWVKWNFEEHRRLEKAYPGDIADLM